MPGKIRRNLRKTQISRWVAFYVLMLIIKMVQFNLRLLLRQTRLFSPHLFPILIWVALIFIILVSSEIYENCNLRSSNLNVFNFRIGNDFSKKFTKALLFD